VNEHQVARAVAAGATATMNVMDLDRLARVQGVLAQAASSVLGAQQPLPRPRLAEQRHPRVGPPPPVVAERGVQRARCPAHLDVTVDRGLPVAQQQGTVEVAFDDERLVADAGLVLPATLAIASGPRK
jgi:hypothetical protein